MGNCSSLGFNKNTKPVVNYASELSGALNSLIHLPFMSCFNKATHCAKTQDTQDLRNNFKNTSEGEQEGGRELQL